MISKKVITLSLAILAASPIFAQEPPKYQGHEVKWTNPYMTDLHGMKVKFGERNIYDLDKTDELSWDVFTYYISCRKHSDLFPFLVYNRKTDDLFEFNVETGELEKTVKGIVAVKTYPPLHQYQPPCPEK